MSNEDRILAEVFDSLIKQDSGKIPSEVGDLFKLGLRLHNECPNIDPVFMEGLRLRLEQEMAGRARSRSSPWGRLQIALRRALQPGLAVRAALAVAIAVGVLLLPAALPSLRSAVQASLSRVITVFRGVPVEQQARQAATAPSPAAQRRFASIEEAQRAAGFALRLPSYLPEGFSFDRALVVEASGYRRAALYYTDSGADAGTSPWESGDSLVVQEYQSSRTAEEMAAALQIGPESAEHLRVAGREALWVTGAWNSRGRWVTGGSAGMLMVQDGSLFAQLWGDPGREEIVRVAASLFR